MKRARRLLISGAVVAVALAPISMYAAGTGYRTDGTHGGHGVAAPKPVAVYIGSRLVASGQTLSKAIRKVQAQIPFAIKTPRYTPRNYVPVQLAVTPRLRGVSNGLSVLSYVFTAHGAVTTATSNGFEIDQAPQAIAMVGGTHVVTVTLGTLQATLHEFKMAGHDLLMLTWVDQSGSGYDLHTDAAVSHLTPGTLSRIAASLHS